MSEQEQLRDRSRSARAPRPTGIARHGRLPRSSAWKTLLGLIGGGLVVVLVSGVSVGAIAAFQLTEEIQANSVEINETEAPIPTIGAYEGGFNMLIVGNDENDDRTSILNDVNILVHVAGDQKSAVAVSIPRDLVVPFPACKDPETGKSSYPMAGRPINEALFYGGLPCAVTVVQNLTGLDIQFAGMIGFKGVTRMADAVGGVKVCVADPIHDSYIGLHLDKGYHELKGEKALKFLRSRHGVGDGSDLTRISSQQVYLSALIRKLKSDETLGNVGRLWNLAQTASKNMQLSKELSRVETMIAMARALDNIPMDRITFIQYPGVTGQPGIYAGKVAPKQAIADALFAAIRADKPIGLEKAGDGLGSTKDPNATKSPTATPTPGATATATPKPGDKLPNKVIIPGVKGQTAADQTCSQGFQF